MNCEEAVRDLPLLAYGELSFDGEEALEQHLENCPSCCVEYQRVQALQQAIDREEVDVPPGLLTDCRRNLRLNLAAVAEQRGAQRFWQRFFPSVQFLKPAGALALLATGFFGARFFEQQDRSFTPHAPVETARADAPPPASRIRFVEPGNDGRVQIVLEETRQRVLSGSTRDDDIRRLLLTAAKEASDPGLRVESVDLLRSAGESDEIRRVLLYALQHDPNPGVRLKALAGLRRAAADPNVIGLRLYFELDNTRARATYRALGMTDTTYGLMEHYPLPGRRSDLR